jgi:hypothetical protein
MITLCYNMIGWWSLTLHLSAWGHRPSESLYPLFITILVARIVPGNNKIKKVEFKTEQTDCSPTANLIFVVISYIRTKCVTMDMILT